MSHYLGKTIKAGVYQFTTLDGSKCLATELDPNKGPNKVVLKPVDIKNMQTWWIYDPINYTLDSYKHPDSRNTRVRLSMTGDSRDWTIPPWVRTTPYSSTVLSTVDINCDIQDIDCNLYTGSTQTTNRFYITNGNIVTDPELLMPAIDFCLGNACTHKDSYWQGFILNIADFSIIPHYRDTSTGYDTSSSVFADISNPRMKVVPINPDIFPFYQTCNPMCACRDSTGNIVRCKEGMVRADNTVEGGIICDRWPNTQGNYDPNDKYKCCMGQYTSYKPDLVQPNIVPNYIYEGPYPSEFRFVLSTDKDLSYPMMIKLIDGDRPGLQFNSIDFGPYNLDGFNYYIAFNENLPSNVTRIDLYRLLPAIDGNKCDSDWCPFSKSCETYGEPVRDFCSGIDSNGHPLLNTDPNCQRMCNSYDWKGPCGDASKKFCQTYPNHPACGCQTFSSSDTYKAMQSLFNVISDTECPGCKVEPDPVCWAPICTQEAAPDNLDARLLTSPQRVDQASCQGLTLNVCQQIIDAQTTYGNITIDNNTFKQACGQNLPNVQPCTYSDWGAWSDCVNKEHKRSQDLVSGPSGCIKSKIDVQPCSTPPDDCKYSDWTNWTDCVDGNKSRSKTAISGTDCPAVIDNQPCTSPQPDDNKLPIRDIIFGVIGLLILIAILLKFFIFKN